MKLNTAVKPVQSKKLTSNKTEKQRQTAGLPDDLPTSAAKMSVLKHQGSGGVSQTTALSLCVCMCMWEGCVFVCVGTWIGYVFRCVAE